MDPARWRQIDELFEATLEKTGAEREEFLAGLESGIRREIERLLEADGAARTFLEGRADSWLELDTPPPAGTGELPKRIGPYKVLGVLGEGGMGRVLLASRADEQYQRLVAIKTLRDRRPAVPRDGAGRGSRREGPPREELLARFDLERQALAQLEHPNIARLYDAGRDEGGDPYLVLEHIDGVPLDAYCDHHRLDVAARLRLFLEVCGAVQVAHKNLLVHRDIKPSNILVTAEGRPMLLDFGIAKLLDPGRIAGELLETREGSRPMTPGYASPEQVKGEPITTASDVYSLGVLLYELLTGRKPYRVTSWLPHELERAICEVEPERPSTAVFREAGSGEGRTGERPLAAGEVARRRATSPGALARHLRGDLDTLLQTALRKDPNQRYASVEAMGQDIRAYLEGRPLAARAKGRFYTLRKFVRRHRLGVAAAALLAVLLLFFLAALMDQEREIRAERDKAQQALAFLIEVFKASDPARARGEDLKARDILDGAARRVKTELAGQPEIQATLMDAMGQIYFSLGLYAEARRLYEQALQLRIRELGEADPETVLTRAHLGRSLLQDGDDPKAARRELEKALADRAPGAPEDEAFAELLGDLAGIEQREGRYDPAISLRRRAAEALAAAGADFAKRTEAKANLIGALMEADHFKELDPLLEELKDETDELSRKGSDSLETADSLYGVAEQMYIFGDPRAEGLFRQSLEIRRKWLAEDHPVVIFSVENLSYFLDFERLYPQALAFNQQFFELWRAKLGPDHLDTLLMQANLAISLHHLSRHPEAFPLLLDAIERLTRLGQLPERVAAHYVTLAAFHREAGELAAAERTLEEATRRYRRLPPGRGGPHNLEVAYARLRRAQQRYPEALHHFENYLEALEVDPGDRNWQHPYAQGEYADLLVEAGRHADARREALASYNSLRRDFGPQTSMLEPALEALLALYRQEGRLTEAARIEAALGSPDFRPPQLF